MRGQATLQAAHKILTFAMKRTLLYIIMFSILLTPLLFGVSPGDVHAQGQANAIDLKVNLPTPVSCNLGGVLEGKGVGICLATAVHWGLFSPVAWVFGFVGTLLNYVVQELVFRMGAMTGVLEAVTISWSVMRDIANVFLVFLVLFIGIATIVRATSYNSKQLLYRVIIAALLVNFSLYFAKVAIDVTNIFAAQTYIMILKQGNTDPITGKPAMENPAECANSNQVTPLNYDSKCFTVGISGSIQNLLRINTLYNTATAVGDQTAEKVGWNLFYMHLMGTVLLLVLIFIFLAVTVLFVTRFVTLVFLMIVSPIAFVSLVTGRFKYGKDWFNSLLNNALFAPVYFLLLWVAMLVIGRMMNAYNPIGNAYNASALADLSGFTIMLTFIVAAALLIGALVAAKRLGISGTNLATSAASTVMFGGAALMYRQTAGRNLYNRANNQRLKDIASGSYIDEKTGKEVQVSKARQLSAQMRLKAYSKAGSASGDVRATRLGGLAGKASGLDLGKATGKGGYAAIRKAYDEKEVKFADSLGVDTKTKEKLENELSGTWVDEKGADGKPVIDPATGKPRKVWQAGVDEKLKKTKTQAENKQKVITDHERTLARLRNQSEAHTQRVTAAQAAVDRAQEPATREAAARELQRARDAQTTHIEQVTTHEQALTTHKQEHAQIQEAGRVLEERKRTIQEGIVSTNRGLRYANTLEQAAKTRKGGIGILTGGRGGTSEELAGATAAIRKKQKNQAKYASTIAAFQDMKEQGMLSEEVADQAIESLLTGTPNRRPRTGVDPNANTPSGDATPPPATPNP